MWSIGFQTLLPQIRLAQLNAPIFLKLPTRYKPFFHA